MGWSLYLFDSLEPHCQQTSHIFSIVEGGDAITRVRLVDAAIAGCTHALVTRRSSPAGAVLWAWDADPEYDGEAGEERLFLRPEKWNSHV